MDPGSPRRPHQEQPGDGRPILKRARSSLGLADRSAVDTGPSTPQTTHSTQTHLQDALDYPRRRAIIACEICRSRKSRCDGGKPKCKLCVELGADCVYREPGVKLDAGDKLILDKLTRIEGMLESSLASPTTVTLARSPISPATSSHTTPDDPPQNDVGSIDATETAFGGARLLAPAANISVMPTKHTTPALNLLQWPVIKDLISRPCDPQVLVQQEMTREPLDLERPYTLDFANVFVYTRAFFEAVNVWYAVVDPYTWHRYYSAAASTQLRSGPESCIVLLVLALGEAAHLGGGSITKAPRDDLPGLSFFATAWKMILPNVMIRNDVLSVQCMVLAVAYLMYLVRPVEAWNLLCNASIKQQLLLSSTNSIPYSLQRLSERVYWNTLMIESELLAELDLPHSGIVQFEESMRLPQSFTYDPTTVGSFELLGDDSPSLFYFLAEIALRRLLNRVSHLMYSNKRSASFSTASLEPVVAELDYQLDQWYEGLPKTLKFPCERLPTQDRVQTVLRLRYFACRTIIYRPYIQAVLADESVAHEPGVQDACKKCLEASLRQLEQLSAHHQGHIPYLWQGALSIVSQALLLMGATLSSTLSELLPPAAHMDGIFADVVAEIEGLAYLAPSLRLCADIIRDAEERRQVIAKRPRG